MPIVVTVDFLNVNSDLYVETHRDVMSGGRPVGMIAHCCFEKDDGVSVIDIWESLETFEEFVAGRVASALRKHAVEGGPENVTITDLINADAFDYMGTVLSAEQS